MHRYSLRRSLAAVALTLAALALPSVAQAKADTHAHGHSQKATSSLVQHGHKHQHKVHKVKKHSAKKQHTIRHKQHNGTASHTAMQKIHKKTLVAQAATRTHVSYKNRHAQRMAAAPKIIKEPPQNLAQIHDRKQDISAAQMLTLLETATRFEKVDLPYTMQIGEWESASTWNEEIQPVLKTGGLGKAKSVFQHMPATFAQQLRLNGQKILERTAGLDLGEDGRTDSQVRQLIQRHIKGKASIPEAATLRTNFTVMAFVNEYLQQSFGVKTRHAKYTNHLLGEMRVASAQNTNRLAYTLYDKVVKVEAPSATFRKVSLVSTPDAPIVPQPTTKIILGALSTEVLNNPGMFYVDGDVNKPRTCAQFVANLERKMSGGEKLVRAKFGAGFNTYGGDVASYLPQNINLKNQTTLQVGTSEATIAEGLVYSSLNQQWTHTYKDNLAKLIQDGFDKPQAPNDMKPTHMQRLVDGLQKIGIKMTGGLQSALNTFRQKTGMQMTPDNPADIDKVQPTLLAAVDTYASRVEHYAGLQKQQSLATKVDLREMGANNIVKLKLALASEGLLNRPVMKVKKGKHTKYAPVPFNGNVDKAFLAALEKMQLSKGLKSTGTQLDTVTVSELKAFGVTPVFAQIAQKKPEIVQIAMVVKPVYYRILAP